MAEYPQQLERRRTLADGRPVLIRPIRADDEPRAREFFAQLSGESRQQRFMKFVHSLSDQLVHFFTHIDYDRHMAFVCEAQVAGRPASARRASSQPRGALGGTRRSAAVFLMMAGRCTGPC